MTNTNKNKILLWFDSKLHSPEDTKQVERQFRSISDYIIFRTDLHHCITFIQSIDKEQIFLITSQLEATQSLDEIACLAQVNFIFIHSVEHGEYDYIIDNNPKIIGIYSSLEELCQSIEEQIKILDKQLQTFSFFVQPQKPTYKDFPKQSEEFLWFQLFNHAIAHLPRNEQQMIEMCEKKFPKNAKQFEREYQPEQAIRWYLKRSFVSKLINQALRNKDIDQLYTFRSFIINLSDSFSREHDNILSSSEEILIVHRGIHLDKKEFDKFKQNQGKLISTNGYFLTSRLRQPALTFAMKSTRQTDVISVLFQIECNIKQLGKSVIFADISQFSEYPKREEILFNLNTCFRIESIEQNESYQFIKMNVSNEGDKITKDYIELTQQTKDENILIIFGRLICNLGQYDKSLNYFQQLLKDLNDENVKASIEHNIGRAFSFKKNWKKAKEFYDRAYRRMMDNKPAQIKESANLLNNIGIMFDQQENNDEALEYYERALKIREKYCSFDYVCIVQSLNYIGNILLNRMKYAEALNCYRRIQKIQENSGRFDYIEISETFSCIGHILYRQDKYNEALNYHFEALKMRERSCSSGHIDIARSLNNVGNILDQQGKYDQALDCHQQALQMKEKYCPSNHVDIAHSLNNIGACYENQKNTTMALDYYRRALAIYRKEQPANNPNRMRIERNILRLTHKN